MSARVFKPVQSNDYLQLLSLSEQFRKTTLKMLKYQPRQPRGILEWSVTI